MRFIHRMQQSQCQLAFIFFILISGFQFIMAENYLINGGFNSQIEYRMTQSVTPAPGTNMLIMSYVEPQTFTSPSYNQRIQTYKMNYSTPPQSEEKYEDNRGNHIIKATWHQPTQPIMVTIAIDAVNRTDLATIETDSPFPVQDLPMDVMPYLKPSALVPSNHPQIIEKAVELTGHATTQFDAVQTILSWIVDHVRYVQIPQEYSAIYSLKTGQGNCQNYSHLAATFMRAVGIPVRIVNGVTLKESFNITLTEGVMTMRMAEGRHSWVEVFFPDLGWVPFDPQQMQLFVSNRFIRVEVGVDNDETVNDGTIRWTKIKGSTGRPKFSEKISSRFLSDQTRLFAAKQNYGPQKMLFTPAVETLFATVAYEESGLDAPFFERPEENAPIQKELYEFGNLIFPEGVNFLEITGDVEDMPNGDQLLHKNFVVETAEFVTSEGKRYSQTFMLDRPIALKQVGLALQKFGGDGQLWIELFRDDGKGKPGEYLESSPFIPLRNIANFSGYHWIDFDFSKELIILKPGRYWAALAYTGSPIVNWFFSYGKPIGPDDGTRYNTLFDESWSHSLSYEFNYRIIGKPQ